MRRISTSILLLLVFAAVPFAASPWTPIADKLRHSIYFLEAIGEDGNRTGSCTGFSIHAVKKHVLTAAHCDGFTVRIDGTPSLRIFKDERKDLMVLRAQELDLGPALKMSQHDPQLGEQVASFGYGFGLEKPMFRIAHVSQVDSQIEELSGPFFMIDAPYIGGQSGGPVVNEQGELISIVQRATNGLGIGVGVETIRDKAGRYFE